jgi:hypothetical protein
MFTDVSEKRTVSAFVIEEQTTGSNKRIQVQEDRHCRISGFHSGDFEEYLLLGYDAL